MIYLFTKLTRLTISYNDLTTINRWLTIIKKNRDTNKTTLPTRHQTKQPPSKTPILAQGLCIMLHNDTGDVTQMK